MNKRSLLISILALIVVSLNLAACEKIEVDLHLNLTAGDEYRYEEIIEQDMVIELQSLEMQVTQLTNVITQVVVVSSDEGGDSELDFIAERIITESTDPVSGTTRFDSSDSPQNLPLEFQGLESMIGQPITVVFDSKGRVKETAGYEEMFQGLSTDLPPDQEPLGQFLQGLGGWYDENSVLGGITGIIGGYPDEPLSEGDTWDRQTTTTQPLLMTIDAVYTVISIEGDYITIEMTANLQADMSEFMSSLGFGDAIFEMSGEQSAEIVIDTTSGLLATLTGESLITATMETYIPEFGGDTTVIYTISQSFERSMLDD
jgi:hypothetical protein